MMRAGVARGQIDLGHSDVANLERVTEGSVACKCGTWLATCVVPIGDGAVAACWLCAHDYVEHDRAIGSSAGTPCDCPKSEIYPPDVIARRATDGRLVIA